MTTFLEMKQKIKNFYGQYEIYIVPFLKFILALASFIWINSMLGFTEALNSPFVVVILALLCAILPANLILYLSFAMVIGHCYGIGIEVAAFALVLILFMLILYLPRKVITFKGFMDSFVEGFKMMIPAIAILIFAWSLKGMGDALEISTFVKNIVGSNTSASVILPAILFVVAVFLSFSTGTSWGTFAILVPIAIAMFPGSENLQMMIISVSAVLAGAVCGDHVSPISDTTVMSSAGAQSNHINHVTTQMQYAAVVAVISFIGYIIAGFVHIWWVVLGISLILLLLTLTVIKKITSSKEEETKAGA